MSLALTPGRALSASQLTDARRLRQLLAKAGAEEDLLVSAGDGCRLGVNPSAVDASRVEELDLKARAALMAGQPKPTIRAPHRRPAARPPPGSATPTHKSNH